jgi:hypothetical protein
LSAHGPTPHGPNLPSLAQYLHQRNLEIAILRGALDRATICSNDPICADREPDDRSGDRATHGAACHGCLPIAETSYEIRNLFLDRNLLVPTMAGDGSFFKLDQFGG